MTFPNGWTPFSVLQGVNLARHFHADPRDVFALWYHEGNLNPRIHPFGDYYGLIGGSDAMVSPAIGTSWSNIVRNGSIGDQIAAIQKFWTVIEQGLHGDTYARRARKIGTTTTAMIYAMNFVPAYAARVTDADGVLIAGSDPYYAQNPAFHTPGKNYISVRDLERKIAAMRSQLAKSATFGPMYHTIPGSISFALGLAWAGVAAGASLLVYSLTKGK